MLPPDPPRIWATWDLSTLIRLAAWRRLVDGVSFVVVPYHLLHHPKNRQTSRVAESGVDAACSRSCRRFATQSPVAWTTCWVRAGSHSQEMTRLLMRVEIPTLPPETAEVPQGKAVPRFVRQGPGLFVRSNHSASCVGVGCVGRLRLISWGHPCRGQTCPYSDCRLPQSPRTPVPFNECLSLPQLDRPRRMPETPPDLFLEANRRAIGVMRAIRLIRHALGFR